MKFAQAHAWHRHIILVLAAQTFVTILRHQAEPVSNPLTPPLTPTATGSLAAFKAARGLLSG